MLTTHWFHRAAECDPKLWKTGFPASIEGKWWYESLEYAQLVDQFSFLYLELRNEDQTAVALAPCFVMDMPLEMVAPEPLLPLLRFIAQFYPALLHQRTFFVGSPCSDRGWIGLNPLLSASEIESIFRALQHAITEKARELKAPMRVWKDMPDPFSEVLNAIRYEFKLFPVVSFPGTLVKLSDPLSTQSSKSKRIHFNLRDSKGSESLTSLHKEAYFASMKPSRRQKLRRTLRRAHSAQSLRTEVIGSPSPELLDQLFSLFCQTYESATTRFEKLNQAFFEAIAKVECSQFIVLYPEAPNPDDQDKKESGLTSPNPDPSSTLFDPNLPLAFMLVFAKGPTLINKYIGLNYAAPKEWFLYFRLWDACVDLAIQGGFQAIESGQTGYDAKISVGHQMIHLTNYCYHSNSFLRWIYAQIGKQVSWKSLDPELARWVDDIEDKTS